MESFVPTGDIRVGASTNLLEKEIVDSVGILSLVSFLEDRFGIELDGAEVYFDTIRSIARLVDAKRSR